MACESQCNQNLFMKRPSSKTIIDIKKVVAGQPRHVITNILAIHAMSGCDTVSALAGIGKNKLIKSAVKDPDMSADLQMFMTPDVDRDTISACGQNILTKLYHSGKQRNVTFDQLRRM